MSTETTVTTDKPGMHSAVAKPLDNKVASSSTQSKSRGEKSQAQLERYLSFYQFERDPFSDYGTRGLFFSGGDRKQAVDSLLHFSRYGSTPIFLTGLMGAGKTSVLEAVIANLENDVDVAYVTAVLMMTPGQMLLAMAAGLGISLPGNNLIDSAEVSKAILDCAAGLRLSNRQAFLCIDNVQDLTPEVVHIIFLVVALSNGNLRLLLVGEQQASAMLDNAAEQEKLLLNRIELNSFDQQDVAAYVQYRLDAVGYIGEFPLTTMQLQALTYRSQGSLSQLNHVVKSMLIAGIDGVGPEKSSFPILHFLALIILSGLILFGWQQEKPLSPVVEADPIVLEGMVNREDSSEVEIADAESVTVADEKISEDNIKTGEQQAFDDEQNGTLATSIDTVSLESNSRLPLLDSAIALASPIDTDVTGDTGTSRSIDTKDISQSELKKLNIEETISLVQKTELQGTNLAIVNKAQKDKVKSTKIDSAHKRLMAWSNIGYALQIFGTHNEKRATQLVRQYFGEADLLFYETRHNGKPWFVVVNGPFTGREAAKASIQSLPESLQRLRPWPRNIASIQADIERYGEAISADQLRIH